MDNELIDADKAILESGDHEVKVQLAKFNTNIADGKDIHIGDRTSHKSVVQKGLENVQVDGDLTVNITQNAIQQTQVIQRPREEDLLLDDVKKEVKGRLKKSLFVENAKPINLKKELQPELVNCPWNLDIKIGSDINGISSDEPKIIDIFNQDEIAGKLLILGEPGSGKTTTLLELAETLVSIAEEQPLKPIPVLLNLSSWQPRQPIRKWMILTLSSKYGKPPKTIEQLLNDQKLLPLLDGLDELNSFLREICIGGINIFLSEVNRPLFLVVCTRKEEYISAKIRLKLNGAVCLLPLSDDQIQSYLQQIKDLTDSHILVQDAILLDLIRIPLFLNLAIISYKKISPQKWQMIDSSEERLQYLWNTYLSERLVNDNDAKRKKTKTWLVWIAQQLAQESKFDFVVAQLQPSKNLKQNQKIVYIVVLFTIIFFIIELAIYVNTGLRMSLFKNEVLQVIMLIKYMIPQIALAILVVSFFAQPLIFLMILLISRFINMFSYLIPNLLYSNNYNYLPLFISLFIICTSYISSWAVIIITFFLILSPFNNKSDSLDSVHWLPIPVKYFQNLAILTALTTITFCLVLLIFFVFSHLSPHLLILIVSMGLIIAFSNVIQPIEKLIGSPKIAIASITIALVAGIISTIYYRLNSTLISIFFPLVITVTQFFLIFLSLAFFGRFSWSWPCGFIFPPLLLIAALMNSFLISYSLGDAEPVWYIGSISGLIFGQITQTILTTATFQGSSILNPKNSNQGIKNSFVNASVIGIMTGLIIGVISGYRQGISFGLIFWLISGGAACIQHFSLRLVLFSNGYIPWDYTEFLNYATKQTILQQIGGSYRFIHLLLQEHLVNASFKTDLEQ